eukprot:782476-Amphidinium_carterae.1
MDLAVSSNKAMNTVIPLRRCGKQQDLCLRSLPKSECKYCNCCEWAKIIHFLSIVTPADCSFFAFRVFSLQCYCKGSLGWATLSALKLWRSCEGITDQL